jgi:hypothetical protein
MDLLPPYSGLNLKMKAVVSSKTLISWVKLENGGSRFLQNVGIPLQKYTVIQPRGPQSEAY